MYFGEGVPEGYDEAVYADQNIPHPTPGMIVSDNGQLSTTYDEEGYLNFRIGDDYNPACYYLIVKE